MACKHGRYTWFGESRRVLAEKCHVTRVANALCCQIIEKLLLDKRVMLRDYFSVDINDEGELVSIPMLLKGYTPCLGKLPSFLLRLGPNVSLTFSLFFNFFFCFASSCRGVS